MEQIFNIFFMILFLLPTFVVLAFILMGLMAFKSSLQALMYWIRGKTTIITRNEREELLEAHRTGFSPTLSLMPYEIFPDLIDKEKIGRIVSIRAALFPSRMLGSFYQVNDLPDLGPDEFKGLALRLYLEMAFARSYLIEKDPQKWPSKREELWIYHTPRPLRKLNPDFYRALLAKWQKSNTQTQAV
jgi:hypothetical protein